MNNLSKIAYVIILTGSLIACGGGGGSSAPSAPPSDNTSPDYSGNTSAAHITQDNANIFVADIMPGSTKSAAMQKAALSFPAPTHAQSYIDAFRSTIKHTNYSAQQASVSNVSNVRVAASLSINRTIDCKISGVMRLVGQAENDGTGVLNVDYVSCDNGDGGVGNGKVVLRIDAFDLASESILDFTSQYSNFSWTGRYGDFTINGQIRGQVSLPDNRETLTIRAVTTDKISTKKLKWDNVVIATVYDDYLNPTLHSESTSGRLYDSIEGYVDIITNSPLLYSNENLDFPDDGGLLLIRGADNSQAKLLVPSPAKARIETDANGDGIYDSVKVYLWTNLATPAANGPPSATVALSPLSPKPTDSVTAIAAVTDPDGDPVNNTYSWRHNGNLIAGEQSATLALGQFVKGDVVAVTVTVSDGTASVPFAASIEIADSPPTIDAIAPFNAIYGVPVAYQLHATDYDSDPLHYELTYGPVGMKVDQYGKLSWTSSGLLIDDNIDVHFGVRVSAAGAVVEAVGTVAVSNPGHVLPLVRTGIKIPHRDDGIKIADFNGDGKPEILVTDHSNLIYTMVYDGINYVQDWVYPFDLSLGQSITSIAVHDVNGDDRPDIIVGVGSYIVILDGVSRRVIGKIDDGYLLHYSIHVSDIDKDGQLEMVYLGSSDTSSLTQEETINVYDVATLQRKWQSPLIGLVTTLALGNVDNDTALEIVTTNGKVYDGATYGNEWFYGPGFGGLVATGDLDNDGVEEIVGMDNGLAKAVGVYSARTKSKLWEINLLFTDMSALLVANSDRDPQSEILIGNVSSVTAYDGISHAAQWSINSQGYGVSSIAIGDVDNDGKSEFVWSSDWLSGGADSLVVAGLNPGISVEWINNNPKQLDGAFVGARWLTTSVGQKRAVFACESTNSYYGGTRLLAVDPVTGSMTISAEIGSNWNGAAALDSADYDGDGIDEVFLGTSDLYDGYAVSYDFSNNLVEWTSGKDLGSMQYVQAVKHGDLNGDGHDDMIVMTGNGSIHAYNPATSTLLWKSPSPSDANMHYRDLEVTDLDGDGVLEIIALSPQALTIYEKKGGDYILRQSMPRAGDWWAYDNDQLAIGDLDGDEHPEIISAASVSGLVNVYDGLTMALKAQYNLPSPVTELVVSQDGGGSLLVGFFADPVSKLFMVQGMTGEVIWASPSLLGQVQSNSLSFADIKNDGKQELIFGTSRAMYITR